MGDVLLPRAVSRSLVWDDMTIRSDGSGRVVESYFAVFDKQSEVRDQDGHYLEVNARSLVNKSLADKGLAFPVFYNHARTLDGTPSGEFSLPIGVPLEIKPDERGVWNAVRYLENPLADGVLGGIRGRAIRGMSYSGRYLKSTRQRGDRGGLPVITRHEVALREFGPTPIPAFVEAEILGFRAAQQFLGALLAADADERLRLLQQYEGLSTLDISEPAPLTDRTPAGAAVRSDEPATGHSARTPLRQRVHAARIARGLE